MMRIAIFGATGATGRLAVREARERGYAPIAIIRPQSSHKHGLSAETDVRVCDVYNGCGIAGAMQDAHAVVSCLGIRRRNALNPWSPLRSPADLTARATANILEAMRQAAIDRFACISAAGVGESLSAAAAPIRLLIRHSNMSHAYYDLQQMERTLERSCISWLALRPTTLTNAKKPKAARTTERYTLLSRIPRVAVASSLIDYADGTSNPSRGPRMITG